MGACKRRLFGTHKPGLPLRQPPIAGSFSIDGVRLLPLMLANSFRLHPGRRLDSDILTRPRKAAQRLNDPVAGGFLSSTLHFNRETQNNFVSRTRETRPSPARGQHREMAATISDISRSRIGH